MGHKLPARLRLALIAAASLCAATQADAAAYAAASLTDIQFRVIDLTPGDGQAASYTLNQDPAAFGSSPSASVYNAIAGETASLPPRPDGLGQYAPYAGSAALAGGQVQVYRDASTVYALSVADAPGISSSATITVGGLRTEWGSYSTSMYVAPHTVVIVEAMLTVGLLAASAQPLPDCGASQCAFADYASASAWMSFESVDPVSGPYSDSQTSRWHDTYRTGTFGLPGAVPDPTPGITTRKITLAYSNFTDRTQGAYAYFGVATTADSNSPWPWNAATAQASGLTPDWATAASVPEPQAGTMALAGLLALGAALRRRARTQA